MAGVVSGDFRYRVNLEGRWCLVESLWRAFAEEHVGEMFDHYIEVTIFTATHINGESVERHPDQKRNRRILEQKTPLFRKTTEYQVMYEFHVPFQWFMGFVYIGARRRDRLNQVASERVVFFGNVPP